MSRLNRISRDERGAILITMAFALTAIIGFAILVVEVGNWFEHKRHLQVSADAAALAAALEFVPDANLCSDTAITNKANEYGTSLNPQIGGTPPGNIQLLVNSATYYNQSVPPDGDITGAPCASKQIDVKMTETDLPWFFRKLQVVPFINAQARVEIQQSTLQDAALPIAVPDPRPVAAAAIFIDESNPSSPTILGTTALENRGLQNLNGKSLVQWDNVGSSFSVTPVTKTGVVILLAGKTSYSLTGTLSEICNQTLVECYSGGDDGPWLGLSYIHGYATSGGTPIQVREARLCAAAEISAGQCGPKVGTPTNVCSDTSAPYFLLNAGCHVGFEARLDTGSLTDLADTIKLDAPGCPNSGNPKGCPLKPNNPCSAALGGGTGCYVLEDASKMPTISAGAGAIRMNINWKGKSGTSNVSGTIPVNGTYAANDDPPLSGPVQFVRVVDPNTLNDKNWVPTGGSEHFVVAIGVTGSLGYAPYTDPPIKLRVVRERSGNASQTQSLDCDPSISTLKMQLATGCKPLYKINTGEVCPNSQNTLWATPQPWPCVAITTGDKVSQVPAGLNLRIYGNDQASQCPASPNYGRNYWLYDRDGDGAFTVKDIEGDPRLVQVYTTPFGSFTGSGNTTVPVTNFAAFYITAYTAGNGQGFANPCENDGDQFVGTPTKGFIYGHFIKYVQPNPGGGSDVPCDFASFGNCVAVMTR